jgi:hypothetical protein
MRRRESEPGKTTNHVAAKAVLVVKDCTMRVESQGGPTPRVLLDRRKPNAKVTVILIDWKARESFHSLKYLNEQTVPRDQYDLVWVEFYNHEPAALRKLVDEAEASGTPVLDKWVTLGYPNDELFHKHRMYNVGILLADGEVCVICDSDAMFPPTFIETIVAEFAANPKLVLHLDEVRSLTRDHYPFNYPTLEQLLAAPCQNWTGTTTTGLLPGPDMLHRANYGACMAARRGDLIEIGGADEHIDYLGYICGPYELTFRLINAGRRERWHESEFIYHTWHPGESGINIDYAGPSDGRGMSLRSLEARKSGRVPPALANPGILAATPRRGDATAEQILAAVQVPTDRHWREVQDAFRASCVVTLIHSDWYEFNVFRFGNTYFGVPADVVDFDPKLAERGAYPICHRSMSLRNVTSAIRRGYFSKRLKAYIPMPILAFWLQERVDENQARVPRLVTDNYFGFNIVSFEGKAYGCRQGSGPFEPANTDPNAPNAYITGRNLAEVASRIRSVRLREAVRTAMRRTRDAVVAAGNRVRNGAASCGGMIARVCRGVAAFPVRVVRALARRVGIMASATEPELVLPARMTGVKIGSDSEVPQLVAENFHGHNIVRYAGLVFACRQGTGAFDPACTQPDAADAYLSGGSVPEVTRRVRGLYRQKMRREAFASTVSTLRATAAFPARAARAVARRGTTLVRRLTGTAVNPPAVETHEAAAGAPVTIRLETPAAFALTESEKRAA